MQSAKTKEFYASGFPKEVRRNKYNLKINERLKMARNRKKLSAARVVDEMKKIGVSISHASIQGYESDENNLNHRYPSLPVLIELANFYGCSLDYLFGLSDKFKSTSLTKTKEVDLIDILESKTAVTLNGKRLSKRQKEMIMGELATYSATIK